MERVEVKVGTLEGLARGVSNASSSAANEGNKLVAKTMELGEDDEAEEVAEVERLRGGVETTVNFESWGGGGGNSGDGVVEVRAG